MARITSVICDNCGNPTTGLVPYKVRHLGREGYLPLDLCAICKDVLLAELCSSERIMPITIIREFMKSTDWVKQVNL